MQDNQDLCAMGVDQVCADLCVVIGKRNPDRIVHVERFLQGTDWKVLDELMDKFNVGMCVLDPLPFRKDAEMFKDRRHGKVFFCQYVTGVFSPDYRRRDEGYILIDRKVSFKTSRNRVDRGLLVSASSPAVGEFVSGFEGDPDADNRPFVHALGYEGLAMDLLAPPS